MFMFLFVGILIALGIAAGALIPSVSDDSACVWITNHCVYSYQNQLELVPIFHFSPSVILKEPVMLGMLHKIQLVIMDM